jgi:hypothetical protein
MLRQRRRRSPASEACTRRPGDKDGQSEDDGQRLSQLAVLYRAGPVRRLDDTQGE